MKRLIGPITILIFTCVSGNMLISMFLSEILPRDEFAAVIMFGFLSFLIGAFGVILMSIKYNK